MKDLYCQAAATELMYLKVSIVGYFMLNYNILLFYTGENRRVTL